MHDEPQTCGEGLAAHAALPEKIGALMQAMAMVLQNHTRSLDLNDENARMERDAYDRLVGEQRAIASGLRALAAAMRGYRDLPAAAHDASALADRTSLDAFALLVQAEESVLALLQVTVAEHRAMLRAMDR